MSTGRNSSGGTGPRASRTNVDAAKKWISEETRTEAKELFAQHTRENSSLDVLSRCKKLNELLSSDVLSGKGDAKAQLKEILGILHAGPKRPAFLDKPPVTAIAGKRSTPPGAAPEQTLTSPPASTTQNAGVDDSQSDGRALQLPEATTLHRPSEEVEDIITLLNGTSPHYSAPITLLHHGTKSALASREQKKPEEGPKRRQMEEETAEQQCKAREAAEQKRKEDEAAEAAERERRAREAAEQQRKEEEAAEAAERERGAREAAEQQRKEEEAAEAAERERGAREAAEQQRKKEEAAEAAELERRAREAAEQHHKEEESVEAAEREGRAREAAEQQHNEEEAAEAAERERTAKEAMEVAEWERKAMERASEAERHRAAAAAAAAAVETLRLQRVRYGAALCIQSHWRGHCGRRQAALRRQELAEQHFAASILQAAWRSRQAALEYRQRLVAAGTLQCAVRAWRARRHLHRMKVEAFLRLRAARIILRAFTAYRARGYTLGPLRLPPGARPVSALGVDGAALLAKRLRLRSAMDARLAPECVVNSGGGSEDDSARQHRTVVTHMERVRQVSANERSRRCDVSERAIMIASEYRDTSEALAIARQGFGTCTSTPITPSPSTTWPPPPDNIRPESRRSSTSHPSSEAGPHLVVGVLSDGGNALPGPRAATTSLRRTQGSSGT